MAEVVNLKVVPSTPCELDFAWYEIIRAELVRKAVGQAGRVLDAGCGQGKVILMLSRQITRGVGVDISEREIRWAELARSKRRIRNVTFRQADATALPFPARSFDVVLLLGDVFSYDNLYDKHARALNELRRVLRTGGTAVHESMNWDWEYRAYPPRGASFTRAPDGAFRFHRSRRDASGYETCRNYGVLPGTALDRWIRGQEWPVSPQGWNTQLEVVEESPLPRRYLEPLGVSRGRHYTQAGLTRLYRKAGFREVRVIPYGQTYDIAAKAGILEQIRPLRGRLAKGEAELAFSLRLGSGPWLFLVARK